MDERLRRAPVGVLEVAEDGTVRATNAAARELVDVTDASHGEPLAAAFPRSVDDEIGDAVGGDDLAETAFEAYYPELERWLAVSVVPATDGATVYVRDRTDRRRRAQALEALRAERDRRAVIDDVLSEVLATLVEASSREEVADTIATALGETDVFAFAWVGDREVGGEDLVVRAAAGDTGDTFPAVREALAGEATTPEERALATGELRTVQPLADAAELPEAVRVAAFGDGVQSALAVPLTYGDSVHGVVGVYARGTDAFADRERRSFGTLAEVAGFAITAARNRNLLLSDRVTEVTFEVGPSAALAALGDHLDADVVLDGLVPHREGALLCFVTADDPVDPADADDVPGVEAIRVVDPDGAARRLECEVVGPDPLVAVASLGGTVRSGSFEAGRGTLVVDLPPDADVRRVADEVSREFDADVVAKRDRERAATTARTVRDELDDRLTDRQRTALRAAFLADYFESPRGSSAEEVAASLDIAGSTLLHHLRAGQRKLLDAYFREPSPE